MVKLFSEHIAKPLPFHFKLFCLVPITTICLSWIFILVFQFPGWQQISSNWRDSVNKLSTQFLQDFHQPYDKRKHPESYGVYSASPFHENKCVCKLYGITTRIINDSAKKWPGVKAPCLCTALYNIYITSFLFWFWIYYLGFCEFPSHCHHCCKIFPVWLFWNPCSMS